MQSYLVSAAVKMCLRFVNRFVKVLSGFFYTRSNFRLLVVTQDSNNIALSHKFYQL